MNRQDILNLLPDTKSVVVVLSGGLDSTIATRICLEKYGHENVHCISFDYGQKQKIELEKAKQSTNIMGVRHTIFDLSALNQISQGFSANVDTNLDVPTIQEVLGDPRPKTYVPNRNMILMSLAASYAEANDIEFVIMGLQIVDEYGYHDTTKRFVEKINSVLSENRIIKIKVIAPFCNLTKKDEIGILQELDGNINLLAATITCYNPNHLGESCGVCPSCSERLKAFKILGLEDPIKYQK